MAEQTLHAYFQDGVSLADVIASLPATGGVAMASTPDCFAFATVQDGKLSTKKEILLDAVFQFRWFTKEADVHWVANRLDAKGSWLGRAVLLTVGQQPKEPWKSETLPEDLMALDEKGQQFLLWGKVSKDLEGGWSVLHEFRVGEIPVPLERLATGNNVVLKFVEYAAPDKFGNLEVVLERFTGLERA